MGMLKKFVMECMCRCLQHFIFSNARSELDSYQRQISGFLMALVSQLCFARQEPPDPEAVEHIFGYIIHEYVSLSLDIS